MFIKFPFSRWISLHNWQDSSQLSLPWHLLNMKVIQNLTVTKTHPWCTHYFAEAMRINQMVEKRITGHSENIWWCHKETLSALLVLWGGGGGGGESTSHTAGFPFTIHNNAQFGCYHCLRTWIGYIVFSLVLASRSCWINSRVTWSCR